MGLFDESEKVSGGFIEAPGIYEVSFKNAKTEITENGTLLMKVTFETKEKSSLSVTYFPGPSKKELTEAENKERIAKMIKSITHFADKFVNYDKETCRLSINTAGEVYFDSSKPAGDREFEAFKIVSAVLNKMLEGNPSNLIKIKVREEEYNGKVSAKVNTMFLPFAASLGQALEMTEKDYVKKPEGTTSTAPATATTTEAKTHAEIPIQSVKESLEEDESGEETLF